MQPTTEFEINLTGLSPFQDLLTKIDEMRDSIFALRNQHGQSTIKYEAKVAAMTVKVIKGHIPLQENCSYAVAKEN
jgi:hypothetical protein